MKFFFALVLIATVASAGVVKPTAVSSELAETQEIVAAINHPNTNPPTAAALEVMRYETAPEAIADGPTFVDSPAYEAVKVAPVAVSSASAPLFRINLRLNQETGVSSSSISPVVKIYNIFKRH